MGLLPPPFVKITRPVPSGCLRRTRLFRLIDRSRTRAPLIWVCGPPGCGKTTVLSTYLGTRKVASLWYRFDEGDGDMAGFFYHLGLAAGQAAPRKRRRLPLLTPEYMQGIPGFSRHFFDRLFTRLSPSPTLAFDNYHAIAPKSPLHEAIAAGLPLLPDGGTVLIASRSDPHPAFAGLRADGRMELLGWEDLRLTLSECREIVRLRSRRGQSAEAIRHLHEATDGWAAGLALMLARARSRDVEPQRLTARPPEEVFDYFGNEVFARMGRAVRKFLVKTAFLPSMTARTAQSLTGQRRAPELLSYLSGKNYFLERHSHPEPVYQYHPLYRGFLLSRAREILGETDALALKQRAAALLEDSGQVEDAAELFCDAGDHESLVRLILAHAPSLLAQGRNRTLDGWLQFLPERTVRSNPWLLLWLGACRMPYDPAGSRSHLESSFELFWNGEDPEGTFLSWSLTMDSLCMFLNDFNGMDEWIDVFARITERYPSFPSPDIEARSVVSLLGGLYMRRVDHPDIEVWVGRALSILPKCGDIHVRLQGSLYLFLYFLWTGNFPKAQVMVESIRQPASGSASYPQIRILFHLFEARLHCGVARFDHSLRSVAKGLELARSSGIHVWDFHLIGEGAAASLGKGDLDCASEYLRQMSPYLDGDQLLSKGYFHYLSSWRAALEGEFPLALSFAETAIALADEYGAPCGVALSHAYAARLRTETGHVERAEKHLERAFAIAKGMWNPLLAYQCRLVASDIAFARGEDESGLASLAEALAIGRDRGYFHYENWLSSFMIRLCVRALREGIEVPYVQELVRRRKLVPASPPLDVEAWPWPVRIYTLGRFEIFRDGKPLAFSRKVQKRPLSLLKAVIAFGGEAVREEQLADTVWPEAEGDMAYQSMSVALRRLRQLLGHEEAVQRREGLFSLDPRFCWVDAFAFERLLAESASLGEKGRPGEGARAAGKALALCRGPFLPGDAALPWTVSMRERLRSRYLRTVGRLGAHFRRTGEWEKARECYQRGLDVDNLAEEFYQSLMGFYLAHGRKSEALAVYERLKKTFSPLGVEPSPKTRELLESVRSH